MTWISVKDQLPERLQVVDIYNRIDGRVTDVKYLGDEEWVSQYMRWHGFVTHWMPLPALPEQP